MAVQVVVVAVVVVVVEVVAALVVAVAARTVVAAAVVELFVTAAAEPLLVGVAAVVAATVAVSGLTCRAKRRHGRSGECNFVDFHRAGQRPLDRGDEIGRHLWAVWWWCDGGLVWCDGGVIVM